MSGTSSMGSNISELSNNSITTDNTAILAANSPSTALNGGSGGGTPLNLINGQLFKNQKFPPVSTTSSLSQNAKCETNCVDLTLPAAIVTSSNKSPQYDKDTVESFDSTCISNDIAPYRSVPN